MFERHQRIGLDDVRARRGHLPSLERLYPGVAFESRDKHTALAMYLVPPVIVAIALVKDVRRPRLHTKSTPHINVIDIRRTDA